MTGPLHGIRVVDLTVAAAGPFATTILAEQGADVIKVERPGSGDFMRSLGTMHNGVTGVFAGFNRGKRAVAPSTSSIPKAWPCCTAWSARPMCSCTTFVPVSPSESVSTSKPCARSTTISSTSASPGTAWPDRMPSARPTTRSCRRRRALRRTKPTHPVSRSSSAMRYATRRPRSPRHSSSPRPCWRASAATERHMCTCRCCTRPSRSSGPTACKT